jgi:hypothetical protein
MRMSKEPFLAVCETEVEPTGRRSYTTPKLTVFGDMKALTAGGSPPVEEGGDEEPNFFGSIE